MPCDSSNRCDHSIPSPPHATIFEAAGTASSKGIDLQAMHLLARQLFGEIGMPFSREGLPFYHMRTYVGEACNRAWMCDCWFYQNPCLAS
jgi:hypothetical protein